MTNTTFTGLRSEINNPGLCLGTDTKITTCSLHTSLRVMAAIAIVACLGFASVHAAEYTFIGNNASWSTAGNWSDGQLPGVGDTGIIAGTEGAVRTARFYSNLPETPDAIQIQPYGELNLYGAHMIDEHNLILEGGRFSTKNWYRCHSTISLHADSFISANAWFYLNGVIQDNGASAGRLIIDAGVIQINNALNSYSGGTVVKGGATLHLASGSNLVGTGPSASSSACRLSCISRRGPTWWERDRWRFTKAGDFITGMIKD